MIFCLSYATNTQAPPAALIFSSARREKNFALTINGCLGRTPLPSTLKYPDRTTLITGELVASPSVRLFCERSLNNDHKRSRLIDGHQRRFLSL